MSTTAPSDGYMKVGQYEVHAWSVSGVETCIVVRSPMTPGLCFDIGYATRASVHCENVFISHGHLDHIAGMMHHASKRLLYNWAPANYYVPPHILDQVKAMCEASANMCSKNSLRDLPIYPLPVGQSVQVGRSYRVVPFQTVHTVQSQGYLVYRQDRRLRPEFAGRPPDELAQLVRSGADVKHLVEWPEIVFTGDTQFDVFLNQSENLPDILRAKLLIMETTYLDDAPSSSVEKARERGHIHLFELRDNADLFREVGNIVLMHFSDKYKFQDVVDLVKGAGLPHWLLDKIYLGLNFFSVW